MADYGKEEETHVIQPEEDPVPPVETPAETPVPDREVVPAE